MILTAKSQIIVAIKAFDGNPHDGKTVEPLLEQMGRLFGKSRTTILGHIQNIYEEGELVEGNTMRKVGNPDFSTKPTSMYNLDVIISVGYRVHSKQGTHPHRQE